MQHMNTPPRFPRQFQDAPRRQHCTFIVAPDRVAGRIALDPFARAVVHAEFVLGMDRDTAMAAGEHAGEIGVVRHQKVAGRGAHEDLDPRRPRHPFELGKVGGVVVGRADVKGMVAPHPVVCAGELVVHRVGAVGIGFGIRHFEHRSHPAQHGGATARFKVFLGLQSRLAEMDLAVDHAGQHVEAGAVDRFARIAARAKCHDLPIAHAQIDLCRAGGQMDGAAGEFEIERRHFRLFRLGPARPTCSP